MCHPNGVDMDHDLLIGISKQFPSSSYSWPKSSYSTSKFWSLWNKTARQHFGIKHNNKLALDRVLELWLLSHSKQHMNHEWIGFSIEGEVYHKITNGFNRYFIIHEATSIINIDFTSKDITNLIPDDSTPLMKKIWFILKLKI